MVLFNGDLRVHDHPALVAACAVIPLFVLDDAIPAGHRRGFPAALPGRSAGRPAGAWRRADRPARRRGGRNQATGPAGWAPTFEDTPPETGEVTCCAGRPRRSGQAEPCLAR
ncbi:deoxyribodipyrimidine photo-lyase [Nonomuraea gerenzanensis]|uniref:deoxyribodipyrimidine photo-lyase n=1 Tax=Nonomuraea gerenzanensis TaxID=93944 RepID=UPI001CDA00DD|nr:deoxyribodipyrimidine photo-lyase [Nonomuraea gerenzanensis]UBU18476.1 deoxyribodipyrimidine photo-lyase [Nonomuraea gerenzanensis]